RLRGSVAVGTCRESTVERAVPLRTGRAGLIASETTVNRTQVISKSSVQDIDEYIARFPDPVQAILGKVRATIAAAAPGATESISYDMPTFNLDGRYLVYFGAYKKHI